MSPLSSVTGGSDMSRVFGILVGGLTYWAFWEQRTGAPEPSEPRMTPSEPRMTPLGAVCTPAAATSKLSVRQRPGAL